MPPHPPSYDALFEMQLEGAQRLVYALKRFSWTFIQENSLHRRLLYMSCFYERPYILIQKKPL
jgi:hypothetical protein